MSCECGGTGRRVRLRGVWETVWVQVPSFAPKWRFFGQKRLKKALFFMLKNQIDVKIDEISTFNNAR